MKILEEFWYGNIEPTEYDATPSKEYKEQLQVGCKNDGRSHGIRFCISIYCLFKLSRDPTCIELATQMSKLYCKLFWMNLIFFDFCGILYMKVATELSQVRGENYD